MDRQYIHKMNSRKYSSIYLFIYCIVMLHKCYLYIYFWRICADIFEPSSIVQSSLNSGIEEAFPGIWTHDQSQEDTINATYADIRGRRIRIKNIRIRGVWECCPDHEKKQIFIQRVRRLGAEFGPVFCTLILNNVFKIRNKVYKKDTLCLVFWFLCLVFRVRIFFVFDCKSGSTLIRIRHTGRHSIGLYCLDFIIKTKTKT